MVKEIFEHKTIRKYKEDCISNEVLTSILDAAIRASNTGNMQVYSIVVTTDEKIKTDLSPAHFNQAMVKQAPVVLTFCADFNRFKKWCKLRNAEQGYDNFMSFMTAAIDAIIAAQNACIEAESHGLGICYLGTTLYNMDKIIEVLNLPSGVVPITTITMGYPAEAPELTERLPREAVVHYERYCDYTDENINDLYEEKENLETNQQFVKENKKETLAQVFTDVRYTKANNEHFTKQMFETLKQQGYLD